MIPSSPPLAVFVLLAIAVACGVALLAILAAVARRPEAPTPPNAHLAEAVEDVFDHAVDWPDEAEELSATSPFGWETEKAIERTVRRPGRCQVLRVVHEDGGAQ